MKRKPQHKNDQILKQLKQEEESRTEIIERKGIEKALRESEQKYRNLFENVPTGIYRTTPDGRILMSNPALVRMLGYSSFEELASRNLEDEGFGPTYSRSQFKELLEREGEVKGLEFAWIRHDKSVIFVRENARAIRGEDGNVLYYEGTVEDISERKRAEEALRKSLAELSKKNRYESIVSAVTQAVHQSINLQEVLENAVEAMSQNIDGVNNVYISLVEGEEAVLKTYRGYPNWFIERIRRIPYPKGATWKTIIDGKPIYCADVDQDTVIGPAGREVGTKSYLCMPIRSESRTVGALAINSFKKNAFDKEELNLLGIVAQQIETAINNAKQAEALEKSRDFYLKLFDDFPNPVWRSGIDAKCDYFNKAWRDFTGRTMEQEMGDGWAERVHPEDLDRCVKTYLEAFGVREPFEMEYRVRHYGGEYRWIVNFGIPFYDLKGNFAGYVGSCYDITGRKQAEEALRKSFAQLAIKNRNETIISTITQSVHQSINIEEVLENAVEAMSKSIDGAEHIAIYLVEGEEAILKAHTGHPDWFIERVGRIPYPKGLTWKTIIERKPRYVADVDKDTAIGPAGRELGIKSYLSIPIHFEGKTVGCINVNSFHKNAFDEEDLNLLEIVTRQIEVALNNAQKAERIKQLNESLEKRTAQLEASNKELESFSYSVSHDLRAPLRAIDGFSRMVLEGYSDKLDAEGKRMLSVIRKSTQKMGQLIDDLLAFSRLGRQEITRSDINMTEIARSVFIELKSANPQRILQAKINTLPPAKGDRSMIRQVFVNLLSNAIKFTRPKGIAVIEVGSKTEDGEDIYYVKDNGVGFDMNYAGKLFGVFQRLHTEDEFEGTGVGLAIVQRVVHRHGGRMWAEGKLDEGATFYFTIPN